ncbi:MAG: hypothetical protein ACRC5H_06050 [Treponemataceae bacterium]
MKKIILILFIFILTSNVFLSANRAGSRPEDLRAHRRVPKNEDTSLEIPPPVETPKPVLPAKKDPPTQPLAPVEEPPEKKIPTSEEIIQEQRKGIALRSENKAFTTQREKEIINDSSHWVLIREEDGDYEALAPSKKFKRPIDGILMHDGVTFKVNSLNTLFKIRITDLHIEDGENQYTIPTIEIAKNGENWNKIGNMVKTIINTTDATKNLEPAGYYAKDDGSITSSQWWNGARSALEKKGVTVGENFNIISEEDWNSMLESFARAKK